MTSQNNIDLLLKNLIKESGADKLPVDLQKQILSDLEKRLNQRFYTFAILTFYYNTKLLD